MESMPAAHFGNFARSCFNRSTSGENRCGSCFEKASRSNSPSHTEGGSWPVPRKNVLSVRFGSNDSGTAKLSELRRRSIESKRSTTPSLQQTAYLYCVLACFVGPDANRFFDCVHEDLSISDFAGLGRLYDCCRDVFHHAVRKDHFELEGFYNRFDFFHFVVELYALASEHVAFVDYDLEFSVRLLL